MHIEKVVSSPLTFRVIELEGTASPNLIVEIDAGVEGVFYEEDYFLEGEGIEGDGPSEELCQLAVDAIKASPDYADEFTLDLLKPKLMN